MVGAKTTTTIMCMYRTMYDTFIVYMRKTSNKRYFLLTTEFHNVELHLKIGCEVDCLTDGLTCVGELFYLELLKFIRVLPPNDRKPNHHYEKAKLEKLQITLLISIQY